MRKSCFCLKNREHFWNLAAHLSRAQFLLYDTETQFLEMYKNVGSCIYDPPGATLRVALGLAAPNYVFDDLIIYVCLHSYVFCFSANILS